jgi:hypothetical protein
MSTAIIAGCSVAAIGSPLPAMSVVPGASDAAIHAPIGVAGSRRHVMAIIAATLFPET